MPAPKTDDDWMLLEYEIAHLFDGAPIDDHALFAGRATEVARMLQTVMQRSKHVVLFGERGVGKTSLSNVFWKRFNKTLQSFVVARVPAGPQDTFSSLWVRALEELHSVGVGLGKPEYVNFGFDYLTVTPSDVRRELQKCSPNALPVIIIDGYNQLENVETKRLTTKLIKEFYDYSLNTTVIIVGVAENIQELISDHNSIDRALVQIPLSLMSKTELAEIVQKRADRTQLEFQPDALWTIITLSRGLPFFTQTLSKHAALHSVRQRRLLVSNEDVEASMETFISDSEAAFKDAYRAATRSNQENYFQQSLLACAIAAADGDGFFTANDVAEPYSVIMKEKKRIAHFEKHLRRFCSDEGGNILIKRGSDRQQRFCFSDPMMQPYVIIRGIHNNLIDASAKALLLKRDHESWPD